MATLAMFKGIFIRMKPEKNMRHHRAHIHVEYQGKKATFDNKVVYAGISVSGD